MIIPKSAVKLAAANPVTATLLALLSIFGGVVLTVIAGFIGAGIQARREHKRWVHDQRYVAFVSAFALVKAFDLNKAKQLRILQEGGATMDDPALQALLAQADDLYTTVAETLAPIVVLGPYRVSQHVMAMQRAYEAGDDEALGKAEQDFVVNARRALRIRD